MSGRVVGDVDEVRRLLLDQRYVADDRLATIVFLALRLDKPLLVEGPAGVGKTELARALAGALDRRLVRLQCYEGLDEAKALYEWEYGKQLLYTHVLRGQLDAVLGDAEDLRAAAARLRDHDDLFFSEDFLVERPILAALRSVQPVVLLIDEVDRADEEFEAFLLEFLAEYQVTVPELGTLRARSVPLVVLTSNRTRELSEALKRRCLHAPLSYPDVERELAILRLRAPALRSELARRVVELLQSLRELELRKPPSVAEGLDWAQALVALGAADLDREIVDATLGVLLKHDRDREIVTAHLDRGPTAVPSGQAALVETPTTLAEAKQRPRLRQGER